VLVGRFGAIARLGLQAFLEEEGCEVVQPDYEEDELLNHIGRDCPDVVVLDMDSSGVDELARNIALGYPAVRVIACSAEQPTMRIYVPFHNGESYQSDLSSALLARAVLG
jgi:DNA-binding NarL/FixJ family response regulator